MNPALMRACLAAWPERPDLDPAEWPYGREELNQRVNDYRASIESVLLVPERGEG